MKTLTSKNGYTTGVYAAAASKAAVRMLLFEKKEKNESIELPSGEQAYVRISSVKKDDDSAWSLVIKQQNQDADVTKGVQIRVTARLINRDGKDRILVRGGPGVGRVTLPGLQVGVGKPAINPVPLRMIRASVNNILEASRTKRSIELTVAVINGEEIAKKTFNPKLGITGGISIIGTSGVVRPMSEDSWKESLMPQVDMAIAAGFRKLVLTFGNLGEKAALDQGFNRRQIIQMSNFVGYILDACAERGVKEIFLIGHIGKVIKVADGHLDTHSGKAKQDFSKVVALAKKSNFQESKIESLKRANSGEAILTILGNDRGNIIDGIATEARDMLSYHLEDKIKVAVAITDLSGKIMGCHDGARKILSKPAMWGID